MSKKQSIYIGITAGILAIITQLLTQNLNFYYQLLAIVVVAILVGLVAQFIGKKIR